MKFSEGDTVKVTTKDQEFEGLILPSKENLILKLSNGYNVGIARDKIKKIRVVKKATTPKEKKQKIEPNKNLPTIAILHTGGTIASKVDYRTGGVTTKFTPEDLINMFPELKNIVNIDSRLISNMWSDDLRFCHIQKIAEAIGSEAKKKPKGIIVGIGTDNLAAAAAGLAFAIEESNLPVILVGAQRSSDRGSTDAGMNLICAAHFITKTDFTGVAICMHSTSGDEDCAILPACKTKKLHTSRRDAFKPVNAKEIALVNYPTGKIKKIAKWEPGENLTIKPDFEEKVGVLKIHVSMHPEQFTAYKDFKGLVIEGTGLGHTPLHVVDDCTKVHNDIKKEIKKLNDAGVVMVMTSNCTFGRVGLNVYSKGRDLQELGVIPGEDMLTDTAHAKLSWLLANHKHDEVKKLLKENLRGEIDERTEFSSEFI